MAGYQSLTIVGNCGRDPVMKYTQSGVAVCDVSLAVSEVLGKNEDGSKREKTTWFKCTFWRELAEVANQYVHKGSKIMCVGKIGGSAYTDKAGQPAFSLEMNVDKLVLLDSKGESNGNAEDYAPAPTATDIPF